MEAGAQEEIERRGMEKTENGMKNSEKGGQRAAQMCILKV